jgi:nucleotide-binding universal stress UspA family protein
MSRRVLVPLDGSPAAETAVGHARAVAAALADGLLLLQVLESPPPSEMAGGEVDWRLRRAEAAAYLRGVAERLSERGVDAETAVTIGDAAAEIVRHARHDDVALVVMAAHGRGDAQAFELGGTCHKVLSLAPASVMVVGRAEPGARGEAVARDTGAGSGVPDDRDGDATGAGDERDAPTGDDATGRVGVPDLPPAPDLAAVPPTTDPVAEIAYRTILVPLDGSPTSEWALGHANAIARRHGATLLVLHLVAGTATAYERLPRSPEESELLERLGRLQEERGGRYLAEVEARLTHTDLPVRTHLAHAGRLAEAILAAATEHRADLIALAAHGAGGAPGRYGTVAGRLLAASACPIVVFQDLRGDPGGRSAEAAADRP